MSDSEGATATLANLTPGATAIVGAVSATGDERRRLLDLGFLPGTSVEMVMRSPLGDPLAFRVRGSVVALRKKQARRIEVRAPQTGGP
jgi:Fe2+ transport system protein FeoA